MTMTEGRRRVRKRRRKFTERWSEKKESARLLLWTLGHRRF
jgi:hypothetical protein